MRHLHMLAATFAITCLAAAPASAEFRRQQKLALAPGGELVVDTAGGSVTVTGGATDGAMVVITSTRDDIEERYTFELTSEPGRARVINRRRGGLSQWSGFNNSGKLHFDVRVPRDTRVDLKSSGGGIRASGLKGNARVRSSGGGLHIADIVGNVDADSSGGGVDIQKIRGNVRASSSGGGVDVARVTGDVTAESSGGGVHVDGVGGRVTAESSGGSVTAVLAEDNDAGGSLSSSGGGVRVTLARDLRLSIDASSSGGSVRSELPVEPSGKQTRTSLRGDLNGGGPTLKLRSSGGGIRIEAPGD